MSKEEPAWKAEIKTALADAGAFCGECGFQPGDPGCPDCVRCWNWYADALAPHIKAAEQRGFSAGVSKSGDKVAELRKQLKTAKADALREAATKIRLAYSGDEPDHSWVNNPYDAATLIDPDKS